MWIPKQAAAELTEDEDSAGPELPCPPVTQQAGVGATCQWQGDIGARRMRFCILGKDG